MNKPQYLAGLVLAFFISIIFPVEVNAEEVISEEYVMTIEEQFHEQFKAQFMLQFQQQYMEQLHALMM